MRLAQITPALALASGLLFAAPVAQAQQTKPQLPIAPGETGGIPDGTTLGGTAPADCPPQEVLDQLAAECDRAVATTRGVLDKNLPCPPQDRVAAMQQEAERREAARRAAEIARQRAAQQQNGVGGPFPTGASGQVEQINRDIARGQGLPQTTGANGLPAPQQQQKEDKPGFWEKLLGKLAERGGEALAREVSRGLETSRGTFNANVGNISRRNPGNESFIDKFRRGFLEEFSRRTAEEAARRAGFPTTFPPDPRFGNQWPTTTDPRLNPRDPRYDPRLDPRSPYFNPELARRTFPNGFPTNTGPVNRFPTQNDPRWGMPGTGFPQPDWRFPRQPTQFPTSTGQIPQTQGPVIINNGGTVIVNDPNATVINNPNSQVLGVRRTERRIPRTFPVVTDDTGNRRVVVTFGISFGQ